MMSAAHSAGGGVRRIFRALLKVKWRATSTRSALTLILVAAILVFPWQTSGATPYPLSDPRVVYVAPSPYGSANFDPAAKTVELSAQGSTGPRLDAATSESSFQIHTGIEVENQTGFSLQNWHSVAAEGQRPANASYFKILLGSDESVVLDVAAIEVADSANAGTVLYNIDFSNSTAGWALKDGATFVAAGNPARIALQVTTNATSQAIANTTAYLAVPAKVQKIKVTALILFKGDPGRFKVTVDWYDANRAHILYDPDWQSWDQFTQYASAVAVTLWYPGIPESARIIFGIENATGGHVYFEMLVGALVHARVSVAAYSIRESFNLTVTWTKFTSFRFAIAGPSSLQFEWDSPDHNADPIVANLTRPAILGVSFSAESAPGFASMSTFKDPLYFFPGSAKFVDLAANPVPFVAAIGTSAVILALWRAEARAVFRKLDPRRAGRLIPCLVETGLRHSHALAALAVATTLYGALALLTSGHPFDQLVFKSWTYAGQEYGLPGIYGRSSSVGDSFIRGGNYPWSSTGFAYMPFAAYLFEAIGIVLPRLSVFPTEAALFGSAAVEAAVKFLLALATLLAGAGIYALVCRETKNRRRALIAMLVFLLNPAVVYDSVVWGETDSVLYLAIVVFAWAASRRPTVAFTVLLVVTAFKQTGLLLAFPALLLFILPRRALAERFASTAKATAVVLVLSLPLLAVGILPSAFMKPILGKGADILTAGGGSIPMVTPDTYTVWTAFTGLLGATGLERLHFPSNTPVLGAASFGMLGLFVFGLVLVLQARTILRIRGTPDSGTWCLALGTVFLAFTALVSGSVSRYYTLAIPGFVGYLALSWDGLANRYRAAMIASCGIFTFISVWTMTGLFAWIMSNEFPSMRGFDPATNPWVALVGPLYLNDAVITVGSVASIIALFLQVILILKPTSTMTKVPIPDSNGRTN